MTDDNDNTLDAAIDKAWMETVKGTWSETDKKIFANGFRRGYARARQELREASETALRNPYVSPMD